MTENEKWIEQHTLSKEQVKQLIEAKLKRAIQFVEARKKVNRPIPETVE